MKAAIWWIRRDLRLSDNQALTTALQNAKAVLPIFILDPSLMESAWAGEKSIAFLFAGLRCLDTELRKRGARLIIRRGDPEGVLNGLMHESGAEMVSAEKDVSPYARERDRRVAEILPLQLTPGLTVHPSESILKQDGKPYTVFTPYSRAWRVQLFPGAPLPAPERIPPLEGIDGEVLPDMPALGSADLFQAGETKAQQRLERFLQVGISEYHETRDRMDLEGTSGLSPYLHFGMVSARQAAWTARQAELGAASPAARRGAETWLNELIWREFYHSILYHFPHVSREAFRPQLRDIPWRNNTQEFQAWAEGSTGYPSVDAGMRQLLQGGWMHNRARMITASFLVKDLLVDWRRGEKHFMQHLLDGDTAANNGGWQWTAGTGTDAVPYFRVFNPVLQGRKFDPHGVYVRRHVPELADVPESFIHEPWKMSRKQQEQFCCIIGKDYPAPIVEHKKARERALMAYKSKEIM